MVFFIKLSLNWKNKDLSLSGRPGSIPGAGGCLLILYKTVKHQKSVIFVA